MRHIALVILLTVGLTACGVGKGGSAGEKAEASFNTLLNEGAGFDRQCPAANEVVAAYRQDQSFDKVAQWQQRADAICEGQRDFEEKKKAMNNAFRSLGQ